MTAAAPPPGGLHSVAGLPMELLMDAPAGRRMRAGRTISTVRRKPGEYRSSSPIEDVEISFTGGASERVVLKHLSPHAILPDTRRVKPAFLFEPRREIETYRHVLGPFAVGAPAMLGAAADDAARCYLLLLEAIPGVPLWQIGEPAAWHGAAGWLAGMHVRLAATARSLAGPAMLLRYDGEYYTRWRARAEVNMAAPSAAAEARRLLLVYERVVPRLLDLPPTFIHGEFHASNILVESEPPTVRITPVDWEVAALAPGLMDLADLTAGKWTDGQRESLAEAYRGVLRALGAPAGEEFARELDYCRLHRAVQWLNWAADWSPPRDHAQDWLGEAMRVCDRLAMD